MVRIWNFYEQMIEIFLFLLFSKTFSIGGFENYRFVYGIFHKTKQYLKDIKNNLKKIYDDPKKNHSILRKFFI